MNLRSIVLWLPVLLCLPASVQGQEEGTERAYVYATYFICDPTAEARADEIIERSFKPHYDAAVEAGNLRSWSWLAHFVGGEWRRVHVLTATNMDDLLDASGALGEILEETTPEAGRAFTEVCSTHEDYIWESVADVASGIVGGARGPAGFSVYFSCDPNREQRADVVMAETLGPVYDRYIESGGLASWAWLKHNVGGEWRRLLTMTGNDHKELAKVRESIQGDFQGRRNERALRELRDICPRHVDYMWDIRLETP